MLATPALLARARGTALEIIVLESREREGERKETTKTELRRGGLPSERPSERKNGRAHNSLSKKKTREKEKRRRENYSSLSSSVA